MMRYLVDTDDDDFLVLGDDGVAFDSVKDAREAALSALPDMAQQKLPDGDYRVFSASVRDEAGTVVYRATLTLAGGWLTNSGGRA